MLKFSLPFLLSYFLQTLYGMADLFIVGQFYGAEVISAVSIGSQVMHMITVMIVGLSMGTSVMIGRYVGADDRDGISKVIANSIILFLAVAIAFTSILLVLNEGIVSIMSTPEESVVDTINYLRICFIGIPFILSYNVLSSIFRGLGDSQSPMKFIAVACIINIILDIILMGPVGMRAEGAAYATVLAQVLSVVYALISASKRSDSPLKLRRGDFIIDRSEIGRVLSIGVPIMCQDGFIQISFLLITVIANQRGVEISAAVGIVEKMISFLFLVPSTMLSTVSTISSQCLGAGDDSRAREVLKYGIIIASSIGAVFAIIFQFLSRQVFSLFTSEQVVIEFATQYMRTYVLDCVFAGVHFSFSGYFTACGKSVLSFIHNIISVVLIRVPGAYLATILFPATLYAMGLAAPIGSLLSSIICLIFYKTIILKGRA